MLMCNQLLIDIQDCQKLLNHSFSSNEIFTEKYSLKETSNFKISAIPNAHIYYLI